MPLLARGSAPFIILPAIPAGLSLLLWMWWPLLAVLLFVFFLLITLIVINFFRDPERHIGKGIISPADGIVRKAELTEENAYVSIFMNVHNVHVNRAPLAGKVLEVTKVEGPKHPAYNEDADHNERVRTVLETVLGKVEVVQMVGIVARRILPYIKPGQELAKGERIGIIRFGSRVDVTFPGKGVLLKVKPGEKVLAGTTSIAEVENANI
jgi:phosphatidylserine decarboxylase